MRVAETDIAGVYRLHSDAVADARGWFLRLHCNDALRQAGVEPFALSQANWSHTEKRGAVRGLHYQQPPHAETKIVRCVRGAVLDLVVDLRRGSPTFRQVLHEELSADRHTALYIPRGCAHGFQVLSQGADLLYLHDTPYHAEAARTVRLSSPSLRVVLPLPVTEMSQNDRDAPPLADDFEGIDV